MAASTTRLTLEQFREQYPETLKPHWEFWFGEARQKPVPTRLHAWLQFVLCSLLEKAGYATGPEVTLRMDPNWEPIPDVIGESHPDSAPYPTRAVDVVAEILSATDREHNVLEKCGHYARNGVELILVFDPLARNAFIFSSGELSLITEESIQLPNGRALSLRDVWSELQKRVDRAALR
jgi:Uma2 family endonuclease